MAVKASVKKKSTAQIAAGKAYAAAGRAAQAATRAAAIKKTGKPPARSKAQTQAAMKFAAAGRAAQAAKRSGKAVPKKKAAIAPESLLLPGSTWPLGCNDLVPTCVSAAVACHLQAAMNITLTNEEILRLHQLAGGDSGANISDMLEMMHQHWFRFSRGQVRLVSFLQVDEDFLLAGLVVGIKLGHEGHAVLAVPGGMISWGQFLPWQGEPDEAWCLEWSQ